MKTTNVEFIQKYLDYAKANPEDSQFGEEFIDSIYCMIKARNGMIELREMMTLAGIEPNKVDSAIPVDYSRSIQEVYPDFVNGRNVYDYTDSPVFGEMRNLNNGIANRLLFGKK